MKSNMYILKWLEEKFPDRLPNKYVSEYELGVLVGNRQVIEDLKNKLKVEEILEDEVK